ncbi:acetyltransferase [Flavihumibacter sediminis]|nr:acetyltransferase [Flavihumibacter sediminis]
MIHLRTATIDDCVTLEEWDKQQHVIDCDPDDDWNWDYELRRFPAWREQLIAESDGRPIGFVQIINPAQEESQYWGEISEGYRAIDIWIGKEHDLNKGYGAVMMKLALERCFAVPEVNTVLIDPLASNIRAIKFYERIGFVFIEDRRLGESDCKIYGINRNKFIETDPDN